MKISAVTELLEKLAPLALQESYDNAGLITGNPDWDCTGITIALDATEEVVLEAKAKGHNLIVAHHPIVFSGLKKFSGSGYVEKALVTAIRQDIALYAIHTNLDNIIAGVNGKMADVLGLKNRSVLLPRPGLLKKLVCFVPTAQAEMLSEALFSAGAGSIGAYSECAFRLEGLGSFKAGAGTKPFVGEIGRRHQEKESRVEVIFPGFLETGVLAALHANHPYEEPAYDLYILTNVTRQTGAGLIGELETEVPVNELFAQIKKGFNLQVIRHTPVVKALVKRVAICGGAGSFLISNALRNKADVFITADLKYHEFFEANGRMLVADIGHFESEQYTIDLLYDILAEKFPTFAVFKTEVKTNPVNYYI